MKTLKITLIATLFLAALTSCTKQDLNEGDIQKAPDNTEIPVPSTGGGLDD
ncbi:hypothetical protein [uncultured Algibacter sp.]|uniref:hypothetical protein n=1 Tax=uncultured Algibacter sp. TaxID=298659 RepID=UPI00261BA176|nr:hypothetical protein [uncultured Algibacter sp.]